MFARLSVTFCVLSSLIIRPQSLGRPKTSAVTANAMLQYGVGTSESGWTHGTRGGMEGMSWTWSLLNTKPTTGDGDSLCGSSMQVQDPNPSAGIGIRVWRTIW